MPEIFTPAHQSENMAGARGIRVVTSQIESIIFLLFSFNVTSQRHQGILLAGSGISMSHIFALFTPRNVPTLATE